MSANNSLDDSLRLLLDDSLKENQTLREQLRQRDEENAARFEALTNKVESLCELVTENVNAGNKETRSRKSSKVHVPTRCRVSFSFGCWIFLFL